MDHICSHIRTFNFCSKVPREQVERNLCSPLGTVQWTRAAEFDSESHRSEIRTYQCEACGGWHTTSRKSMALSA